MVHNVCGFLVLISKERYDSHTIKTKCMQILKRVSIHSLFDTNRVTRITQNNCYKFASIFTLKHHLINLHILTNLNVQTCKTFS